MADYRAIYIDDQAEDAHKAIERLNSVGPIKVEYLAPSAELNLSGVSSETHLFFVDWELNRKQVTGETVDYKGATFAARLREKFEHVPIILITREGFMDSSLRRRFIETLVFDEYIPKNHITTQPEKVIEQCVQLITGFLRLGSTDRTWPGLVSALQAREDEEEILGEATPPLMKENDVTVWSIPEISRWVRNTLLKFPGILYNALYTATFLGIDIGEFSQPDVQDIFRDAKYTGVFESVEGRWWRGRLINRARSVIAETGAVSMSINKDFATALQRITGREIRLSECVYSKRKPADWVCYVLNKPVLIDYSLAYHPDNRPVVMDEARVSFTAIRESNNVFDEYFDPSSRSALEQIRS